MTFEWYAILSLFFCFVSVLRRVAYMSELWGSERLLLPVSLSIVVNSLFSLRTITCIAHTWNMSVSCHAEVMPSLWDLPERLPAMMVTPWVFSVHFLEAGLDFLCHAPRIGWNLYSLLLRALPATSVRQSHHLWSWRRMAAGFGSTVQWDQIQQLWPSFNPFYVYRVSTQQKILYSEP